MTDLRDPVDEPTDWAPDPWDAPGEVVAVERVRRQTRVVRWVAWVAGVVVIALILAAGVVGWWYVRRINPPGDPGAPITFTVEPDDTVDSIADRLLELEVIVDAGVFRWYVDRQGGLELTPGYYQVRPGDHLGNLLGQLRTPPARTFTRVTFPEGFTVAQMATRLGDAVDPMDADDFLAAAAAPAVEPSLRPPGVDSLEGLLFPDTYEVSNGESEAQVIERMIALMERVARQEELEAGAARLGRTPYEILIIASMIEREAKLPEDRAKISAVIHNRLSPFIGMPLQIDATLYYGQDPDTPFSQLRQIDSPYNTYLYQGLPPTPIANPGRASIQAALNPAPAPPPTDPVCRDLPDPTSGCFLLFYVLADEDGGHAFAVTLEQHEANVARALAAGLL